MKILLGEFNTKVGNDDILSRKLRMKTYTKLFMIMELQ
jgi:hypothetical protein